MPPSPSAPALPSSAIAPPAAPIAHPNIVIPPVRFRNFISLFVRQIAIFFKFPSFDVYSFLFLCCSHFLFSNRAFLFPLDYHPTRFAMRLITSWRALALLKLLPSQHRSNG